MLSLLLAVFMPSHFDPRGPILQPGPLPIRGAEANRVAIPAIPVKPNDVGPQVGKWIWSSRSLKDATRFRKTVVVTGKLKDVRAWIAADVRYRLWINGVLASRGPADVGRDYDSPPCGPWFEDVRDLSRYFRLGKNEVAVEVLPFAVVGSEWPLGHPGLKIDLDLSFQRGSNKTVATDESWKCSPAPDFNQSGAQNGFRFDMNLEPEGWQLQSFDDSHWDSAAITSQQLPTIVSELPPGLECKVPAVGVVRVSEGVRPSVKTGGAYFSKSGAYTLQYGNVLSGYVGLRIRGHKGARLLVMPNEHDSAGYNRRFEVILREGEQMLETPYFDSFSVINVLAVDVTKPIEIEDIRCVFTSYPVEYRGAFTCSDPALNRMWEVCRWVTQICMQTHHLDSPHHQEPVSDAGDYLIESLNSFYAFGEGTLARQDLKKISRNLEQRHFQGFHTSYSLLWLQMLMQYYDYSGDADTVKELAKPAFALLDQFETYIGTNGLISNAPNYMFMDWVEIEGFTAHHPPAVIGQGYMTALYFRALADGIRVAKMTGDDERAAKFEQLRGAISASFDRELWVPGKGLYHDGKPFQTSVKPNQWLPADKDIETFSTQANTLAVACGLTSSDRAKAVMRQVVNRTDLHCQPYFMHFVFQALQTAGIFGQYAPDLLKRWHIEPDTKTFYEMWGSGDLSHAWNATPLYQMSGWILGVKPLTPGFDIFEINPHPSGLTWAKGIVPTPHGDVRVEWKQGKSGMSLKFDVPAGTKALVQGRLYDAGKHQL